MEWARRLKIALAERKLSQRDLAGIVGVGESTISNYVAGLREPNLEQWEKMAKALDYSPAWLVGWSEEPEPDTYRPFTMREGGVEYKVSVRSPNWEERAVNAEKKLEHLRFSWRHILDFVSEKSPDSPPAPSSTSTSLAARTAASLLADKKHPEK